MGGSSIDNDDWLGKVEFKLDLNLLV